MGLAVSVLVGALVAGRLLGGSVAALGTLPVRRTALVLAAFGAQAAGALLAAAASFAGVGAARAAYAAGLATSALLALAFLALNRSLPGVALVTLGLLANALVVLLNGAMPVSLDAAARAGAPTTAIAAGTDPRHEVAGAGTRLGALGDVVPVALPLRPEVVSPGDVLVVAGLAQLVVTAMLRRPDPPDATSPGPGHAEGAREAPARA